jgi:anti-anti-sigma factor
LLTDAFGELTLVRLEGTGVALDEENALSLRHSLLALVRQGRHQLAVDLANVHFLGSTMIEAFLAVRRALKAVGGRLMLYQPTPAVAEVFTVLRLASVLDLRVTPPAPSLGDAVPA